MPDPGDLLIDLVAGQLTALTRLGPLGHLDLNVVRVDQILGGHTETTGCHLFDRGTLRISGTVGQRIEALGFLSTLTGIGLTSDLVHRPGQRRVGLVGDRTEGHGSGSETFDDLARRLHFFQRYGFGGPLELEQPSQSKQDLVLLIDRAGKRLIGVPIVLAYRMLQLGDGVRGPDMVFTTQTIGVVAPDIQMFLIDLLMPIGLVVPLEGFGGDLHQPRPLNSRGGTGEIGSDELTGQSHRIEDLCPAIGLISGNSHLGHDLLQPFTDGLDVTGLGLGEIQVLRKQRQLGLDGIEGQVGVDRLGAITGQGRVMMHLQGRTGLHHQARFGAQSLADQMVMYRRGRQ